MIGPRKLALFVAGLVSLQFISPGPVGSPGTFHGPDAVTTLAAIHKGQILFSTACGDGGYATSLEDLATPAPGTTEAFLGSLGPPLTDYTLTLSPTEDARSGAVDCHGHSTTSAYYVSATPTARERSRAAFAMSEDGEIWRSKSGRPPTQPFGPPAISLNGR